MPNLIDHLRAAPEAAVRLLLGACIRREDGSFVLTLEGRETRVSPEVLEAAREVAGRISQRPRGPLGAQDILELRHEAEDLFLERLFGKSGLPRVLFVPAGISASGFYRAMWPADLMHGEGALAHFTRSLDLAKALRYDILWIQLVTTPILLEIVLKAQAAGVRLVYDVDDRLDAIPGENQAITVYGTPEKQAEIRAITQAADLVTVSTAPLAAHMAVTARRVLVLPNMIPANVWPRGHPPDPRTVRILWAGSPTHKRDLAIAAPAIRDVLIRHAGRVRFTLFGERLPEALAEVYGQVDLREPVDFEDYADALASIGADFAIAPLEPNAFNESKSAIKALEYAAAGYPMLLSPVGEYPDVVAEGLPAELVPRDGWEAALERMIARTSKERRQLGDASTRWVCARRCIGTSKARQWTEAARALLSDGGG